MPEGGTHYFNPQEACCCHLFNTGATHTPAASAAAPLGTSPRACCPWTGDAARAQHNSSSNQRGPAEARSAKERSSVGTACLEVLSGAMLWLQTVRTLSALGSAQLPHDCCCRKLQRTRSTHGMPGYTKKASTALRDRIECRLVM